MKALGIDAGGSSTRWLILDDAERILGRGSLLPITGHVFNEADRQQNLERLQQLLSEVKQLAIPKAVVAGITGFHKQTPAQEMFLQLISAAFDLPRERVDLDNDLHVAYAAAFAPGEGVLLYAGTGSVGYHETVSGEVLRAGGYGFLVDDAGAGYWIGHEGIKAVMRLYDQLGYPAETELARGIYQQLGSYTWSELMPAIYAGGRSTIAGLAPIVAKAAHLGDDAAIAILGRSGTELARLATVILQRLDQALPVVFSGGISQLSPIVEQSLRAALPPKTALSVKNTEPVLAAAKLALKLIRSPIN